MALDRKRLAVVLVMAGGAWLLLRPRALSVTQPSEVFGADIPPEPSLGTSLLRAGKGLAITSAVGLAGAGLEALSDEVLGADPLGFISQGDPINGQPALSPVEADLNPIKEIGVIEKKLPGAVIEGAQQASKIFPVGAETFTPALVGKVPTVLLPPDPIGTVGIAAAPNLPQPLPDVEIIETPVPGINIDVVSAGAGVVVGAGVGFGLSQIDALKGTPVPQVGGAVAGAGATAALSGTAFLPLALPAIPVALFGFVVGKILEPGCPPILIPWLQKHRPDIFEAWQQAMIIEGQFKVIEKDRITKALNTSRDPRIVLNLLGGELPSQTIARFRKQIMQTNPQQILEYFKIRDQFVAKGVPSCSLGGTPELHRVFITQGEQALQRSMESFYLTFELASGDETGTFTKRFNSIAQLDALAKDTRIRVDTLSLDLQSFIRGLRGPFFSGNPEFITKVELQRARQEFATATGGG